MNQKQRSMVILIFTVVFLLVGVPFILLLGQEHTWVYWIPLGIFVGISGTYYHWIYKPFNKGDADCGCS